MRRWRQRLPDVRSKAGRPTATDRCSYGLNSREFPVTLKPYCGSCGSMACCLKFAAGKSTGLWNSSFTAQRPNQKWVTDISYIHTAQGVLYLSIIRDLFDNSIVAYKTRTDQSVGFVLPSAMHCEKRRPLGSCSSTAAKAFNTPLLHISA